MGFDFPSKYARHLQSQKHKLTVEFSFDGLALTDTSHPVDVQVETRYEGRTELNADTVPNQLARGKCIREFPITLLLFCSVVLVWPSEF